MEGWIILTRREKWCAYRIAPGYLTQRKNRRAITGSNDKSNRIENRVECPSNPEHKDDGKSQDPFRNINHAENAKQKEGDRKNGKIQHTEA